MSICIKLDPPNVDNLTALIIGEAAGYNDHPFEVKTETSIGTYPAWITTYEYADGNPFKWYTSRWRKTNGTLTDWGRKRRAIVSNYSVSNKYDIKRSVYSHIRTNIELGYGITVSYDNDETDVTEIAQWIDIDWLTDDNKEKGRVILQITGNTRNDPDKANLSILETIIDRHIHDEMIIPWYDYSRVESPTRIGGIYVVAGQITNNSVEHEINSIAMSFTLLVSRKFN